jgi:hypothetical protein
MIDPRAAPKSCANVPQLDERVASNRSHFGCVALSGISA